MVPIIEQSLRLSTVHYPISQLTLLYEMALIYNSKPIKDYAVD